MLNLNEIGKVIKTERESQGMTQKTLAKGVKVTQTMVSYVEKGKTNISFDSFVKICAFLGLSFRVEQGKIEFYHK
jgi:transcriptional regulator with XRE-family HTH domain